VLLLLLLPYAAAAFSLSLRFTPVHFTNTHMLVNGGP
jgi:hypothetical protein